MLQGSSKCTEKKYGLIDSLLTNRISQLHYDESFNKRIVIYDVYSGCGTNQNDHIECKGTPYSVWRMAQAYNVGALCSDIDPEKIKKLKRNITKWNRVVPYKKAFIQTECCNSEKAMEYVNVSCMNGSHVIIILDPNGPKSIPIKHLEYLSKRYTFDIILNVSERALKLHKKSLNKWYQNSINDYIDFYLRFYDMFKHVYMNKKMHGDWHWRILSCFGTIDCNVSKFGFEKL